MSALEDLRTLPVLGPYEITGLLGRGGMGVVYRGVHKANGRPAAIKTAYIKDAGLFACMRREIHALSRLRHSGVVRIIEEGVENGIPWYAMELLDNTRSLHDALAPGSADRRTDELDPHASEDDDGDRVRSIVQKVPVRSDLPRVLTLMYRLCRVLGYIHSRGVVHRDLKPQNVLVRGDDRPVLVDFGLVGRFRADSSREVLEVGGRMMGTLAYSSPEQADGALVDARTDLYAFGVMLYEAVTGRLPFQTRSAARLMHQLFFEPPVAPSYWVDGLPPVLDHLVLQLMQKKPRDRYGYADDVASLLVEAGAQPEPDVDDEASGYLYRPELEGRGAVIEILSKRLEAAKTRGAFVAVGGVSGIGKTSVATAFSAEAARKNIHIIAGECVPVTTDGEIGGDPLHPLRPLLQEIAGYCMEMGQAEFDRVIGPRIAVLKEYDPSLAALAQTRGEESLHLGAQTVRRRLFPDLAETLAAFTADRPLLLILDDLQWADEITLRFLASLRAEFFDDNKLMILGLYRSDEVGPELGDLLGQPHISRIALERLDDDSVAAIVKSMLSSNHPSEKFLQFVAQQSMGSPFFVAEYLRAAVNERLLYREGGRWRLRHGEDDAAWSRLAPRGSLLELVGHRISALSSETRLVAEVAAVLGREFNEELLIAAAGGSELAVMEAINDLVERQILEPVAGYARFVHDKQREVLYGKLSAEKRRDLHRRAAVAFEAYFDTPEKLQPHIAELANHWEIAGEGEKAIDYYEIAGKQALRTGAAREASDYLLRILSLDEGAPMTPERRARRAHWHSLLAAARWALSDFAGSDEHAGKVLALAGKSLPATRFAAMRSMLGQIAEQSLHLMLPRVLYRSRKSKWPLLAEAANSAERIAERAYYAEDVATMFGAGLLAVNLAERTGGEQNVGRAYSMLAVIANLSGLKGLARRYFGTGTSLAKNANDIDGLMHIGYSSSIYHCGIAEWEEADAAAAAAIELARRVGDPQNREIAETILGHVQYYRGEVERAAQTYAGIRDSARKRANVQHEGWAHVGLARSLILLGRLDEAQTALDGARKAIEIQPDHISEVCAAGNQVALHFHRGDLDVAAEAADAAYALTAASPLVLFEMFRGYAGPAEVYLEVWRRAQGKNPIVEKRMKKTVGDLCAKLRKAAFIFPLVTPWVHRLSGIARCLDGDLRRGRKLIEKSALTAARLRMPVEEAVAELDLVRYADLDPLERAAHRERARKLFRATGCHLHLQSMTPQTTGESS